MLDVASHEITAHSHQPVTELIRGEVEKVLQASTSENGDNAFVSARERLRASLHP